ncbi:hypothetical protein NCCP2716_24490 [Sporosarcina sp. NCCP-2716]|uniref:C39 family peptidase n=1 Tax=Sporosarcina sp. NCCP-2716 TaxID=2943679 RepID=UPI00203F7548|nr:C39 family peptidase [Sporosarcina sp. NCCP-2716]GKV69951.1 hypothetical protein NCCP2716_24490 [Sporosarcina sp. NCCP-2716]
MPIVPGFKGMSQYDETIGRKYRPSACGPVTASLLLRYLQHPLGNVPIDKLYRLLGGTRAGLFTWRFVHRLRALLGSGWTVGTCSLDDVLHEIDSGRPAAAKFDKWFSLRWRTPARYDYHWVPVVGYERTADDVLLFIHDNGSPSSASRLQTISYRENAGLLTFVKVGPAGKRKGH